ncbi:Protein of unknown function [Anaerobranca californiensis DSM 14826]|jgi:hypothetical protein|uniref:DUF1614 domain-containing protein n=1 Tax=Anaerobranca californiensis DSM 14826 TaxID=1120989 RepID=A0A1M6N735_9FIRM|nr:DUF1614 domain-containing protein [Anaerobranca californiensis]SHJ91424.1 Protein of unknown function [Anaerobranca californiensis DSM 14826]
MPVGPITLTIVTVLIFFGLAQRVLDRMYLTDKAALAFIGAMFFGAYIPDIPLFRGLSINVGGGIVPLILVGYLFVKAGTAREKIRAILASLAAAVAVFAVERFMPSEPGQMIIDPLYMSAIVAGVIGYLAGRSRRSSFIAGIMGIILTDIYYAVSLLISGNRGGTTIGGAGIYDAVVIAGILAVVLAEVVGETRERLQGGPEEDRPEELKKHLRGVEFANMLKNLEEDWEKDYQENNDQEMDNKIASLDEKRKQGARDKNKK